MAKQKKQQTPMEKLTAGYEEFIKGKELKEEPKKEFDKVLKKVVTPKEPKKGK